MKFSKLKTLVLAVVIAASPALPAFAGITCVTEVRFSPRGGAEELLVNALSKATTRVYISIYGLTAPGVVQALIAAHQRGVALYIKADKLQSAGKSQIEAIKKLSDAGVVVVVSKKHRQLHNKFAVIDGKVVITGSYNWTANGNLVNAENVVQLTCPALALLYEEEWKKLE